MCFNCGSLSRAVADIYIDRIVVRELALFCKVLLISILVETRVLPHTLHENFKVNWTQKLCARPRSPRISCSVTAESVKNLS